MKVKLDVIVMAIVFSLCFPGTLFSQTPDGYEITGYVKGLEEGEKVVMYLDPGEHPGDGSIRSIAMDSGYVKKGVFHIEGYVPYGTHAYYMQFEHSSGTFMGQEMHQGCTLIIDNHETIVIRCDSNVHKIQHDELTHFLNVDGSPTYHAWKLMGEITYMFEQNWGILNRQLLKIQDSLGFDKGSIGGLMKAKEGLNFIFFHAFLEEPEPDLKWAIPMVSWGTIRATDHSSVWPSVYRELDEKQKSSFYGKRLKGYINLCVGEPMPEFRFPDSTNKMISLKEMVAKSKVTLVHFWASNSYVQKKYDDELRILYKKYKEKGLTIIGVSTELYKEAWKESLQAEQYPWYNVVDLKGKMVDTVYHELGNPVKVHNTTNVLIDSNGKIIAWDPTGAILQWYLEEYLGEDAAKK